jgi:hypothetical protein
MALLLGGYALRTVDRNWDWEDEERLFRAAFRVRKGFGFRVLAAPTLSSPATPRVAQAQAQPHAAAPSASPLPSISPLQRLRWLAQSSVISAINLPGGHMRQEPAELPQV